MLSVSCFCVAWMCSQKCDVCETLRSGQRSSSTVNSVELWPHTCMQSTCSMWGWEEIEMTSCHPICSICILCFSHAVNCGKYFTLFSIMLTALLEWSMRNFNPKELSLGQSLGLFIIASNWNIENFILHLGSMIPDLIQLFLILHLLLQAMLQNYLCR